jgi:hypothetical protein
MGTVMVRLYRSITCSAAWGDNRSSRGTSITVSVNYRILHPPLQQLAHNGTDISYCSYSDVTLWLARLKFPFRCLKNNEVILRQVLGRTNHMLSFYAARTAKKTTCPVIFLLFQVHLLQRKNCLPRIAPFLCHFPLCHCCILRMLHHSSLLHTFMLHLLTN